MRCICIILLISTLFATGIASARTWTVLPDSTGDAPTIQAGIDSASSGDTVVVMCGTYYEHDISVKSGIRLTSETGDYTCVTIDADSLGRVFQLTDVDSTTQIIGFTAARGSAEDGGGIYCTNSDARFTDCCFRDNVAVGIGSVRGGGAYLDHGSPVFTDCRFSGNETLCLPDPPNCVEGHGGGVYAVYGSPRFIRCRFSRNSNVSCQCDRTGAGFSCGGLCAPVFEDCLFDSNATGAAYIPGGVSAVFSSCTFKDNSGALLVRSDDAVFEDCLFEGNFSSQGGALYIRFGSLTVSNCRFYDNNGGVGGGGVFSTDGGSAILSGCTFAGNSAPRSTAYGGGGILLRGDSSMELVHCTFSGNSTPGQGGGVRCTDGSYVSMDGCIVAFSGDGEAVYWDGSAPAPDLSCCDFYGNADGDWVGAIAGQLGINGNISEDPLFENAAAYDFRLRTGSPCLDEDGCGIIGAHGWICGLELLSVTDTPNDLGGFVDVTWSRLCFDSAGSDTTVDSYSIWRRAEPGYATGGDREAAMPAVLAAPPGTWECIDSVAAAGDEIYMRTCPSLCDSTEEGICWTAFLVKAHCSGPPLELSTAADSGYSVSDYIDPSPFELVSIIDTPGDQGGFVDITWNCQDLDSAGSDTTVDSYSIWRRAEPGYAISWEQGGALPAVLAAPPGTWECIDSIAAVGDETYTRTCPSLCDSTDDGICWTAFLVKAHCSSPPLEFSTPADSGYSVWDLCDSWTDVTTGTLGHIGPGSGLAWIDYDGDGDLDIYFTNRVTDGNVLLRNDDLTAGGFVDATPSVLADSSNSRGCPWGDYDGDGDPDLYVSNKGANKLLRNDGGGSFVDVTASPLDDASTGQAVAWFDFDNDGDLDLYQVNNGANKLFRNDGAGVFTDVTSGALGDSRWGMGIGLADYDNDGDMDIYIANYNGANALLENQGGGAFADVTTPVLECALPSYGAAWGDYDDDGDLDLYVTNEGSNALLRNDAGSFVDVSAPPVDDDGDGRSAAWADCDNDGDLDLYVVNDGINRIFRSDGGGGFGEVDGICTPLKNTGMGFGTGWADYDKDGDLDIYLVNEGANKLFRNELAPGSHWLEVAPVGTATNASGIGARVRIVAGGVSRMREIGGASGFASQGPLTAWFGLGAVCTVDTVEVIWPASGAGEVLTGIACDQTLEVVEDPLARVPDGDMRPSSFMLHANRPNPFSSETAIRYDLPERSRVDLKIYDAAGRSVRVLLDGEYRDAGRHVSHWDGRNSGGKPAAPGIYFCRFTAGRHIQTRRLVLLR